jgi:hypothetical protein
VSTLTFKRPMSDICDGTTTLLTAEWQIYATGYSWNFEWGWLVYDE